MVIPLIPELVTQMILEETLNSPKILLHILVIILSPTVKMAVVVVHSVVVLLLSAMVCLVVLMVVVLPIIINQIITHPFMEIRWLQMEIDGHLAKKLKVCIVKISGTLGITVVSAVMPQVEALTQLF